ncbi:MAG TPA: AAA domain-containing protein [Gemmataceae bacterium]|nr:AAA domain-containing protein [Gemmataceae bacterium]
MALLHLDPLPPRTTKGEILDLLCTVGGLRREQVGRIDLHGALAVVEVPTDLHVRVVKGLDGTSFKQKRLRAWHTADNATSADATDHFERLARLLNLESQAEAERILEKAGQPPDQQSGDCLVGLIVAEEASGLGGRFIVTLAQRNRTAPLPWNRLEPGAPVLLSAVGAKTGDGWRGVVCERSRMELRVALNEPPGDHEAPRGYRLDLAGDETARQRQLSALERARTTTRDRLAELRHVLLGETLPAYRPETPLTPLDASLNPSQQDAIRFALSANDLAILHGPPGTGKTTAVIELIRQAVRRGQRVLACAPSNLAVDNMLERLLAAGERVVRLGHPARVLPELREHTLDLMVEDHDDTRQARKLAKKAFALFRQASKWTRAKPEPGLRQQLRQEGRALLDDARALETQAIDRILSSATVLCATLTGLDSTILGQRQFDLAVIDEAAQCTEPVCWLPLLRSQCLVLAGDHCQLPPTLLSQAALEEGFGISLMERLVERFGSLVTRRLNVQYRMHEAIMAYSSQSFYDGDLVAHASVRSQLLCNLPGVSATRLTQTPIQFIDTAGAGYEEQMEQNGSSRFNPQEAGLVDRQVHAMLAAGIPAAAIAVIAPYAAQVRLLREKLQMAGLEIDSIDGFQGREKEVVLLSLVRSNPQGEVGFLADIRRMNVALTRARRKLLVIGDSATLSCHPFYQGLIAYFESIGAYTSVWEETD